MPKKPLVVANWKMNFTSSEARRFAASFKKLSRNFSNSEAVICAPFTCLESLSSMLAGTGVKLGAQNIFFEEDGTFTGEISARMAAEFCTYAIIGHSERRKIFFESNKDANLKAKAALKHGLKPLLCVGETSFERKTGKTKPVLRKMVLSGLEGISRKQAKKISVCYEPLWAISKGSKHIAKSKAASPQLVQEVHAFIRRLLSKRFGKRASGSMKILYGGSIKPSNTVSLMSQPDIDGGLVGGSSLDPKAFSKVVKLAGSLK